MAVNHSVQPSRFNHVPEPALTYEELNHLLIVDRRHHLIGPIAAIRREITTGRTAVAEKHAKNTAAFLPLFPGIGGNYETQEDVCRVLKVRGEEAELITKRLRSRILPYDWSILEADVGIITREIDEKRENAIDVLQHNNLPLLERGIRRREFEALTFGRKSSPDIFSLMADGEFYFGAQVNHKPNVVSVIETQWRRVVTKFLKQQYQLNSMTRMSPAMAEHMRLVSELPLGALYAYTAILAVAYPLPAPENPPDDYVPEYAPNPVEWVRLWKKKFAKDIGRARLELAN